MNATTTIIGLIVEALGALSRLAALWGVWLAGRRGAAMDQAARMAEVRREQLEDSARPPRRRDELLERMRRNRL